MLVKFQVDYTTNNRLLYKHWAFDLDVTEFEAKYGILGIWESAVHHALAHLQEDSEIMQVSSITIIRD